MTRLLDSALPRWDFADAHAVEVAAAPERTWRALHEVTVRELPVARLLMALRGLGGGKASRPDRRFIDAAGFLVALADEPCDRVSGMVGKPWRLRPERVPIAGMRDFAGFDAPGYVRIAADFRVVASGAGSRLSTETRIAATDAAARRRFARYWRVVRIGSGLVRRDVLRAARERAERP